MICLAWDCIENGRGGLFLGAGISSLTFTLFLCMMISLFDIVCECVLLSVVRGFNIFLFNVYECWAFVVKD